MELLVGIILPPIVELCNRDVHSNEERYWIAFFVCVIAACLVKYQDIANGNGGNLFFVFLLILAEAVTTFNLYWKTSFPRTVMQQKLGVVNNTE